MGTGRVHAGGSRSGADLEPAPGSDLLNRLMAGTLPAVGTSIRVDARGPIIGDLRHLSLLDVQPYLRLGGAASCPVHGKVRSKAGAGGGGRAAGVLAGDAGLLDECPGQRTGAGSPAGVGVVSLAGQGDFAAVGEEFLRPSGFLSGRLPAEYLLPIYSSSSRQGWLGSASSGAVSPALYCVLPRPGAVTCREPDRSVASTGRIEAKVKTGRRHLNRRTRAEARTSGSGFTGRGFRAGHGSPPPAPFAHGVTPPRPASHFQAGRRQATGTRPDVTFSGDHLPANPVPGSRRSGSNVNAVTSATAKSFSLSATDSGPAAPP